MLKQKEPRFVLTFHTTAEAMATERLCHSKNLDGKLISAPRTLTPDCGIAWSAPPACREALLLALEEAKIEFEGQYELLL